MEKEERQRRLEELQLLEDNQTFQLLQTRLKVLQNSKRQEQREAACKAQPDVVYACELALWGLEKTDMIVEQIKRELRDRPEKAVKY